MKERLETIDLLIGDALSLLTGVSGEEIKDDHRLQQAQDLLWSTKIVIAQSSTFLREDPDRPF